MEDLKEKILRIQGQDEHWGYTGDFDENECKEILDEDLAKNI